MKLSRRLRLWLLRRVVGPATQRILRSPFHGLLSGRVVLVSFTRGGEVATIPLTYMRGCDAALVAFIADARHRRWWHPLVEAPQVSVRLAGREDRGLARIVTDPPERLEAVLRVYAARLPKAARKLGIAFDGGGRADGASLAAAAEAVAMIVIELDERS